MYDAPQTARLQASVDQLPTCLIAGDIEETCKAYADIFRKATGPGNSRPPVEIDRLITACNALDLVGKELYDDGGTPNPDHHGVYLFCRGSDGYTKFLTAYASAYRAWDDIVYAEQSNWAGDIIKGTKALLNDVGGGLKSIVKGVGEAGGSVVWDTVKPLLPIIGGVLVTIVLIAFFTKGKISIT